MRGWREEERENPKGPEDQEGGGAPAGNRGYLQHRPRFAVRLRLEGRTTGIAAPPGALGHPGGRGPSRRVPFAAMLRRVDWDAEARWMTRPPEDRPLCPRRGFSGLPLAPTLLLFPTQWNARNLLFLPTPSPQLQAAGGAGGRQGPGRPVFPASSQTVERPARPQGLFGASSKGNPGLLGMWLIRLLQTPTDLREVAGSRRAEFQLEPSHQMDLNLKRHQRTFAALGGVPAPPLEFRPAVSVHCRLA
eukprot:XP_006534674.1 PREDICTED: collagen alpha-1(II) chain-like [Mus musculus]